MSHTGKLLLVALSAVVLAGGTAAQVPDSAVSVTGTLGSIGQSSTNTGPFKFDNSQPDLSLAARVERGKAVPPKQPVYDSAAMRDWMKFGCLWNSPSARNAGAPAETCIHQVAAELPPFDPAKPRHFGEHYSPRLFLECKLHAHEVRGQGQFSPAQCEKFRLRRIENPTFWPYEHNKDFKWPEAPKESVYRPGMTPEAYHKALCEKESGQWVYKRVEGVKSIYLVRPYRTSLGQDYQRDRFVEEAPFLVFDYDTIKPDHLLGIVRNEIGGAPVDWTKRIGFDFVEAQFEGRFQPGNVKSDGRYVYAGSGGNLGEANLFNPNPTDYFLGRISIIFNIDPQTGAKSVPLDLPYRLDPTDKVKSRVGIVWRDIERAEDRVSYVGGIEVAIVDLETNELLGLYRTFVSMGRAWESSKRCDWYRRDRATLSRFLYSVVSDR